MGGKLEIYSKQGRGTNMTLQIPALSNTELDTGKPNPAPDNQPVLVYDENQHTRRSFCLLLERKKYRYRSLSNVDEFIKLMPSYKHLIIGVSATDIKNLLIQKVVGQISDFHNIVTIALPNGHPLPALPKQVSVINKPIRPASIIPSDDQTTIIQTLTNQQQVFSKEICAVVAEDNFFNQILIGKILEKHNITAHIASNGKEALVLIEKYSPDIAIIDIHMPIMDGFEATKIIRQNGELPIISLTANIIEKDHQKIIAAGSNAIVLKPINDVELIQRIKELTQNQQARAVKQELDETETVTVEIETSDIPPTITSGTNIADYDLDQSILKTELERLLDMLDDSFTTQDTDEMRSTAHQLVGLAGLYELPEVELATLALQNAVKSENIRETWVCLSRLKRIVINNSSEEELEDQFETDDVIESTYT